VDGALARVGLTARADERVKAYSLGMRQRLGVARCLLADPELLILDEPMNGLDPAGIQEFRRLIRELVAEGRTVLLSSHLLDEVERTCDVAAIVDQGKVVAQGADPRAGARRPAGDRHRLSQPRAGGHIARRDAWRHSGHRPRGLVARDARP
jgi:ABC-2 type transport system ATP-binding protein